MTTEEVREKLNSVSNSFCLAKWYQVTVHLQNGHTHSCHHPGTHKIPLEELKTNPSALHNTNFKKERRREMLDGKRPEECGYCWNIEDSDGDHFSDRHFKSEADWAMPGFDDAVNKPWDYDHYPRYMEISFGNVCNFKCMYCYPNISSQWMEESETYGPYPTSLKFGNLEHLDVKGTRPIPEREHNPYVEAFWKWWPDLYQNLHTFRITGGEPLLNKNTFKVLKEINNNPRRDLELAINSNLCVPDKNFNEYINLIKQTCEKLDDVRLYTSLEAVGSKAEYIRFGLNYNKFWSNIDRLLHEIPKLKITFMCTYNALSVTSFTDFLKEVDRRRFELPWEDGFPQLQISTPYLRHPEFLSIKTLDNSFRSKIEESINYMEENAGARGAPGFTAFERSGFKRILSWFDRSTPTEVLRVQRMDFVKYFDEYDKRKGTNFLKTFPEYTEFYNMCKKLC
jgi:organic radical activating enzyme